MIYWRRQVNSFQNIPLPEPMCNSEQNRMPIASRMSVIQTHGLVDTTQVAPNPKPAAFALILDHWSHCVSGALLNRVIEPSVAPNDQFSVRHMSRKTKLSPLRHSGHCRAWIGRCSYQEVLSRHGLFGVRSVPTASLCSLGLTDDRAGTLPIC